MSRMYRFVIVAMATAVSAAPIVCAQAGVKQTSVRVAYGDLDLSTRAGAATLLKRMKAATRRVCGAEPSPREIAAMSRHQVCAQDAMSRAVAAIDSPLVTALFTGESGEETAAR
jgi:UrcA family protein